MFDDITFYVQNVECVGTLSVSVSTLTGGLKIKLED